MGSFLDQMKKNIDEAPEAGTFSNAQLGKLTVTPYVVSWKADENGKRMPERKELVEGYELQQGETFELLFSIDIKEFNPSLDFLYERNIPVRKTKLDKDGNKEVLTDWSELIEPSLIAVFGEDWLTAVMKQPYVEIEDAPNVAGRKSKDKTGPDGQVIKPGKVLGVPKFIRVFKNRAECAAAHEERFGKSGASNGAIPPEAIAKTQGLLKSLKNERKVLDMLGKKPFGDFDPELLLALAKA